MALSILKLSLPLLAALGAGCTTTGFGTGTTGPVRFDSSNSDSVAGTAGAMPFDGETYSEQLFQITRDTTAGNALPLWSGWRLRWGDSGGLSHWDSIPSTGFVKRYLQTDQTNNGAAASNGLTSDARCTVGMSSIESEADAQDATTTNRYWRDCGGEP